MQAKKIVKFQEDFDWLENETNNINKEENYKEEIKQLREEINMLKSVLGLNEPNIQNGMKYILSETLAYGAIQSLDANSSFDGLHPKCRCAHCNHINTTIWVTRNSIALNHDYKMAASAIETIMENLKDLELKCSVKRGTCKCNYISSAQFKKNNFLCFNQCK